MVHLDYRDARPIYAQIIDTYRSQISFLKMKTSGPLQSAFLTAVRQKALLMNSGTSRGLLTSFGYNQSSPW